MKNLINKVQAVQHELKAPKGNYNSFGKYKYRSCEDILEAVKPLLDQNGLVLTLTDDIVGVEGRVYVKATARITDGEHEIQTVAYAREAETKKGMDESQITGTASSYARKYALNGLFCIDDAKDADTDAYKINQQAPPRNAPNKDAIRAEVLQLAQTMGMTPAQVAQEYKLNANSTVEQLVGVLDALKQRGVA